MKANPVPETIIVKVGLFVLAGVLVCLYVIFFVAFDGDEFVVGSDPAGVDVDDEIAHGAYLTVALKSC